MVTKQNSNRSQQTFVGLTSCVSFPGVSVKTVVLMMSQTILIQPNYVPFQIPVKIIRGYEQT